MREASMIRAVLLVAALLGTLFVTTPVVAQDPVAEVRTWSGQTLRLTQASLEVFYTILVKSPEAQEASDTGQPSTPGAQPLLFGSAKALSGALDKKPEPLSGQRQATAVTIKKAGVETKVPLASLNSLTFSRVAVASTLPPYLAPTHFRYAATAILTDGSRVEGDYVNLGTTVLRGMTAQGRVDIPWQEIEMLRLQW
jgi:hypothetical protein